MHINELRIAHEESGNGVPFNVENVAVPDFKPMPHAKSADFANFVSTQMHFYLRQCPNDTISLDTINGLTSWRRRRHQRRRRAHLRCVMITGSEDFFSSSVWLSELAAKLSGHVPDVSGTFDL
jgi:hypothetical protein